MKGQDGIDGSRYYHLIYTSDHTVGIWWVLWKVHGGESVEQFQVGYFDIGEHGCHPSNGGSICTYGYATFLDHLPGEVKADLDNSVMIDASDFGEVGDCPLCADGAWPQEITH